MAPRDGQERVEASVSPGRRPGYTDDSCQTTFHEPPDSPLAAGVTVWFLVVTTRTSDIELEYDHLPKPRTSSFAAKVALARVLSRATRATRPRVKVARDTPSDCITPAVCSTVSAGVR